MMIARRPIASSVNSILMAVIGVAFVILHLPVSADVRSGVLDSLRGQVSVPDILYAIDDTKLYAVADTNGIVIAVLTKGAPLEILNRSTANTWLKVRSTENSQWVGYVPAASTSAKPVLQESASNKQTTTKSTNDIAAIQQSRTQAEKDYLSAQTQLMLEYYDNERERERQEAEEQAQKQEQQRLADEEFQRRQDEYAEQVRQQSMATWEQLAKPSYIYGKNRKSSEYSRNSDIAPDSIYEPVTQAQNNDAPTAAPSSSKSSSQPSQNLTTGLNLKPKPPVPQSSSNCNGSYPQGYVCARAGSPTWYGANQRDTAIGMARTIAFTDAATKCSGGGPYTSSTPRTPNQSDPAWILGNPDCRESYGHTADGTALLWCEIEVSAPCTPR